MASKDQYCVGKLFTDADQVCVSESGHHLQAWRALVDTPSVSPPLEFSIRLRMPKHIIVKPRYRAVLEGFRA
jgi:hypothetical protein